MSVFLLMALNVNAAYLGGSVARGARSAQNNVLGLLRYRQSLSKGQSFVNSNVKGDPAYVLRSARFVDGQLAKYDVAFDPSKDSPESFVQALDPKKVEALDKHLGDMQLDYSAVSE
jgi:hypothetical protein